MAKEELDLEDLENGTSTNDVVRLILALLSGIKLLTAALGFHFFSDDLYVAIANIIPVIIIMWTMWDAKREKDKVKEAAIKIAQAKVKEIQYEEEV
ncbi:hypothetical protein COJ96_10975 [Bacillus sp. AFS073361]|nr:hypothetical protein COJ96_10975 [Bacillus sp. AFS073361]